MNPNSSPAAPPKNGYLATFFLFVLIFIGVPLLKYMTKLTVKNISRYA
jgi:hypothetical protein